MKINGENIREVLKKITIQNSQLQDTLREALNLLDEEKASSSLDYIPNQNIDERIIDFTDISPMEMAHILHKFYSLSSSTEIGQILLEIYTKLSRYEMQRALNEAGFLNMDTQKTLNVLYPITVKSSLPWQATGVIVGLSDSLQIISIGKWGVNNEPSGQCDANGISKYKAKEHYTLPGKPEGALIGRIGDNPPYLVGTSSYAPKGQIGELYLCINDDLNQHYGLGLKDNIGELKIIVTIN